MKTGICRGCAYHAIGERQLLNSRVRLPRDSVSRMIYVPLCSCGAKLKVFASSCRVQSRCPACARKARVRKLRPAGTLAHKCVCVECGAEFRATHQRKTCSAECLEKTLARRITRARKCEACGREFRKKSNTKGLFCSVKCRGIWRSSVIIHDGKYSRNYRPVYFGPCEVCGCFVPTNKRQRICSTNCAETRRKTAACEYHARTVRAQAIPKLERKCSECGMAFTPIYGDKRKRFCSDKCAVRTSRRKARSGRRARIRNTHFSARIDPIEVFKRDAWMCRGCGCETPRHLRGTLDDDAPEMDHIVPLSMGGQHSPENVQTLCRLCNQLKSGSDMNAFANKWLGGRYQTL